MIVTWKLFWAAVGAAVTVALAVGLLGVSLLVTVLVVGAVVGVFTLAAAWVIHGSLTFCELRQSTLRWFVRGLGLAAAVHAAWIITFHVATDRWPLLVVALGGLALAEYGTAAAVEYVLTRLRRPRADHGRKLDQPEEVMAAALERAGYGYLQIRGWDPIDGEDPR